MYRFRIKSPKRFFWVALSLLLLLSGGHISAQSAQNTTADLIISEFVAENGGGLVDEDGDHSDWIEIYNSSPWSVNLAGWALTNTPTQPQQWFFPDISLGSGEYLVVFASGKNRKEGPTLHTSFKLNSDGEFLGLYNMFEGRFADTIEPGFPRQFRDISYGRPDDGQAFGYLATPSPGVSNEHSRVWADVVSPVQFSVTRGFFTEPFSVELSSATPGAVIRFTTDGSAPTADHGQIYTEPLPVAGTILLRAAAFAPDLLPAQVETQSYLFLEDVLPQLAAPASFAESFGRTPGQTENNVKVRLAAALARPAYRSTLLESLQAVPSLSLVTNGQNLTNLHTSPQNLGRSSEYLTSLEFLPVDDATPGFQIDAGVRSRSRQSNAPQHPKQSFQIYFRGSYGASRLNYPLFEDSPAESFDSLVLLAGDHLNQTPDDIAEGKAHHIRSQWLANSQIATSGLGIHGRFVHLYLNGQYWGLYDLAENPDEDFMETYLGGKDEDWFVADRHGPAQGKPQAQAETLNYLFTTLAFASQFEGSVVSADHLSEVFATAATYLDPTQFADFVILNAYARTLGWPLNNWTAAVRMQDLPGRGKIFVGEEYFTGNAAADSPAIANNVVRQLFEARMQNPDFRVLFADRLNAHLTGDGALTDAAAQERWQALSQVVDQAILAEFARWGSEEQSLAAGRVINPEASSLMDGRGETLMGMARHEGYYPAIDPPRFDHESGIVDSGTSLKMRLPPGECRGCVIFYTTDGTDPRLPVTGGVIPTAQPYTKPVALNDTTRIRARVWQPESPEGGPVWSALHQASFTSVPRESTLRITEIMYNPAGGDDYEYVELQNVGNRALNMAKISLDDGVRFTFPPNAPLLLPGETVVLVSNAAGFARRYPDVPIGGQYEGHLSNKGETIVVKDADGKSLMAVQFDDENGWPVSADGRGDSLTLLNVSGDPGQPKNWRASDSINGNPGVGPEMCRNNLPCE